MGCSSSKKSLDDRASEIEQEKAKRSRRNKRVPTKTTGEKKGSSGARTPKYRTRIDSRVLAKYDIKALIGKGSFSDVLRVENKITKQPFAVKILRLKTTNSQELFESELAVLRKVRHQFIIQLVEVFESKDCIYLVMELATGGELYDRIKMKGYLSEKETVYVLRMVLEGVKYLHGIGVTHRDLKPENVLFYHPGQYSKILITDFGFAKSRESKEEDALFSTWCGTPEYIAPELIWKKPYTNAVDMWAIGVITYVMLSGQLPFSAENTVKLYQQIVRANYSYSRDVWKNVSQASKSFIDTLLVVDPDSRSTADVAVKHPWLVAHNAQFIKHSGFAKNSSQNSVTGKSGKSGKSSRNVRNALLRPKYDDENSVTVSRMSHDVERRPKKASDVSHSKSSPSVSRVVENKRKIEQGNGKETHDAQGSINPDAALSRLKLIMSDKNVKESDLKYVNKFVDKLVPEEYPSIITTEGSNTVVIGNDSIETGKNPFSPIRTEANPVHANFEEMEMDSVQFRGEQPSPVRGNGDLSSPPFVQFQEDHVKGSISQHSRVSGQGRGLIEQTNHANAGELMSRVPRSTTAKEVSLPSSLGHSVSAKRLHTKSYGNLTSASISPRERDTSFMEKVGQWLEEQRELENGQRMMEAKSFRDTNSKDLYLGSRRVSLGNIRETYQPREVAVIGDYRRSLTGVIEDIGLAPDIFFSHEDQPLSPRTQGLKANQGSRFPLNLSMEGIIEMSSQNRGLLNRQPNGFFSREPGRPVNVRQPLNRDFLAFTDSNEAFEAQMGNSTNNIFHDPKLDRSNAFLFGRDRESKPFPLDRGKEEGAVDERKDKQSLVLGNGIYAPTKR